MNWICIYVISFCQYVFLVFKISQWCLWLILTYSVLHYINECYVTWYLEIQYIFRKKNPIWCFANDTIEYFNAVWSAVMLSLPCTFWLDNNDHFCKLILSPNCHLLSLGQLLLEQFTNYNKLNSFCNILITIEIKKEKIQNLVAYKVN